MMMNLPALLVSLGLSLGVASCNRNSSAASPRASAPPSQAASAKVAPKVTKIVFVGKEHACECTRKSIDAGWAALQKALGTPAKLPIERLQVDTEGEKVAPYREQKPMMALPAIYFLDGKNAVIELLQGEVSETEIAAALKL
jgi:hypothetical protein